MTKATTCLARSITWSSSKQSYLIARLLADRPLADDCLRGYAYFRWADDMLDVSLAGDAERAAFISRQKALVDRLYHGDCPDDLSPQEAMLRDLIAHNPSPESGLHSFIINFMDVIAFDAGRHGRIPILQELVTYTTCLATAVMDGLQYFIGYGQPYPKTHNRLLAVTGAHLTHMLRDTLEDLPAGLVNIPAEDLEAYGILLPELNSEQFRDWVQDQVALARDCFQEGQKYIDSLDNLRCKLAGVWYCARFACVLDAIQRDGYRLRAEYPERHALKVWLEMARLGVATIWKHYRPRLRSYFFRPVHRPGLVSLAPPSEKAGLTKSLSPRPY